MRTGTYFHCVLQVEGYGAAEEDSTEAFSRESGIGQWQQGL